MKLGNVTKQIVLFLEGADRCGKTNIGRALESALKIPYFKASLEHQTFLTNQKQFLNDLRFADPRMADMIYQLGSSIIVDRSYPSEWVYSQYFERETDMKMLRQLDTQYAKIDAKIVICTRSSYNGIQDDLDQRLDSMALKKIDDLYKTFGKWTQCQTMFLNVDDENLVRECTDVLTWLGHRDQALEQMIEAVREHEVYVKSIAQIAALAGDMK